MIRVEGLASGYEGRPVLAGVTFAVERGEFIGILGPNGAGKTTLVHALSGVVPVLEGRVEILGTPVQSIKTRERARRMAVVGQTVEIDFPFTCEEVVWMGRYPHRKRWQMETAEDSLAVARALRLTDTEALSRRMFTALSGGERQRVIMARTLAQETPVLLLDEPTSAMDIHRRIELFAVLDELNRTEGLTVLAVLHDINLAALFCRRLMLFDGGRLVADGPTDEVLTAETIADVYRVKVMVQDIPGTDKRQVVFLPQVAGG